MIRPVQASDAAELADLLNAIIARGGTTALCVVLAIGWRVEQRRAGCWRDVAEEGVAPEGKCD